MGTGEDDDTEDGQEDSSPIELDWVFLPQAAVHTDDSMTPKTVLEFESCSCFLAPKRAPPVF